MKFLHLSDLHFHSRREDNLEAIETFDLIRERYPDHRLIVTGDIVDDGYEAQYHQAFETLKPFIGRIFICPGNHDFGAWGNLYNVQSAKRFDQFLSLPLQQGGTFAEDNLPVLHFLKEDSQKIVLIALDTNVETASPLNFACGQVGETQLAALDKFLSDRNIADMMVIVLFHHHPFSHTDPFKKLLDARQLARILYGRVHLVLFGHRHVSRMWQNTLGIPYILASDNSPGKITAREITIVRKAITVQDITIESEWDIL